jgi:hypothetical protein
MIGGLPAPTGVQRRAIEDHTMKFRVDGSHPRVEVTQVAIGLEQLVGCVRRRHVCWLRWREVDPRLVSSAPMPTTVAYIEVDDRGVGADAATR